jgi:hypothetical protein
MVPSEHAPIMSSVIMPGDSLLEKAGRRHGGRMSPRWRRTTACGRHASKTVSAASLYVDSDGW